MWKKKSSKVIITGFGLLLFAITACSPDQRGLDKSTRQLIESLARTELIRRDEEVKQACDSIYQYWFDRGKDSIYALRVREIEQIIGRQ